MRNNFSQIVFVFVSAYDPYDTVIGNHLVKHGDGAKDVAFEVEELDIIVDRAKAQGAVFVRDIWSETDDYGTVRFATVKTVRIFRLRYTHFTFVVAVGGDEERRRRSRLGFQSSIK